MYLVLVWLFFPETRGLTIEEVSLIFDTGRLGNAAMATAELEAHTADMKGNGEKSGNVMVQVEDNSARS